MARAGPPRPRLAEPRRRPAAARGDEAGDAAAELLLASRAEMDRLGEDVMRWDDAAAAAADRAPQDLRVHGFHAAGPDASTASARSRRSRRQANASRKSGPKRQQQQQERERPRASKTRSSRSRRAPSFAQDVMEDPSSMLENLTFTQNVDRRDGGSGKAPKRGGPSDEAAATTLASFQDVVFPPLRTVLWDRTPLGDSCVLGTEAHVPSLRIRRAALASLYNDAASKTGYFGSMDARHRREIDALTLAFPSQEDTPSLAGFAGRALEYAPSGAWVGGTWEATIQSFYATARARRPDEMRIFCAYKRASDQEMAEAHDEISAGGFRYAFEDRSERALGEATDFSQDEYARIIRKAAEKFRARGPADPVQYLDSYAVCKALPGNRLMVRAEVILPSISLEFTPITPLSILGTPLARQLDQWAAAGASASVQVDPSDPTACGFVTLNQTRKAVFLLEDDPMAYELPLVGIWLRSSTAPEARRQSPDWQDMLNEPLLWSVCLRYIHNDRIREKVSPPESPSTFLVVVYPPGAPMPQFLECSYSMFQDRETLSKVGVASIPFLQLETAFEVDVGMLSHPQTLQQGDAVEARFYHVEALARRQAFREGFEEIVHAWPNPQEQGHRSRDLDLDRSSASWRQEAESRLDGRRRRQTDLSEMSSRPPSPPTSTPPPPPPSYAPPVNLMRRQSESMNGGDISSMYFRPEADDPRPGGHGLETGAFGGIFDDEEDGFDFGDHGGTSGRDQAAGGESRDEFSRSLRGQHSRPTGDDDFDFRGQDPPAQHTMLSTIYGANLTRFGDSIAPNTSPLQTSRLSDANGHRGGQTRPPRQSRAQRAAEAPSYLTSSFDTSALAGGNQSMASSRTRRSKTRSRQYYSMLSAQQQQITLMQQQILGLQKLMEEQIRVNSLSRAQTMALSAEVGAKEAATASGADGGAGNANAKGVENPTSRPASAHEQGQAMAEAPTAIYLAGLQQYDDEDETEIEERPSVTPADVVTRSQDEADGTVGGKAEGSQQAGALSESALGPAATAAASASLNARRDAAQDREQSAAPEPVSVASSSGIGSTFLRIPSNSTDDSSEPPSIIREDVDAEEEAEEGGSYERATQGKKDPRGNSEIQGGGSQRGLGRHDPREQPSISNIYAEMDTEFGIPQIREVEFTGGSRRARLDTEASQTAGAAGGLDSDDGRDEEEEEEEDDDEWLAAVEAKYLKQARESGRG